MSAGEIPPPKERRDSDADDSDEEDDDYEPSEAGDSDEGEGNCVAGVSDEAAPKGLPENADDIWADFLEEMREKKEAQPTPSDDSRLVSNTTDLSNSTAHDTKVVISKEQTSTETNSLPDFDDDETLRATSSGSVSSDPPTVSVESHTVISSSQPKLSVSQLAASALKTVKRKPVGVGIGSLLDAAKKPKLSTFEQSKQDWNDFTEEKGISEELQTHNKGKHGYLQKQEFLQRSDHLQFNVEKEIRDKVRKRQQK